MSFAHEECSEYCGQYYISLHAQYERRSISKVPCIANIEWETIKHQIYLIYSNELISFQVIHEHTDEFVLTLQEFEISLTLECWLLHLQPWKKRNFNIIIIV
jgi:hypothetical protein